MFTHFCICESEWNGPYLLFTALSSGWASQIVSFVPTL